MQQEITVRKERKLQDAGRLCSTILQSLPGHPDAHHNLALLMVSSGMTSDSLRLFKQARDTANVKVSAAKNSVKANAAFLTEVLFSLVRCTRAQRNRFFSEPQRIIAWLEFELVTGSALMVVVPVLPCALISTAVAYARAADQ